MSFQDVQWLEFALNQVSSRVLSGNEKHLLDVNQTIEKDVYVVINNKGYHMIAAFSIDNSEHAYKLKNPMVIDLCLNEKKPMFVYDDLNDYNLDIAIGTINNQKTRMS